MKIERRYPIGAEVQKKGGTHFRVWAPDYKKVEIVLENGKKKQKFPLEKEKNGYFSLYVREAGHGTLYRFKLKDQLCTDPASRFQPQGPFGPSCVIDPFYKWTDTHWKGVSLENQIIYEMHIGTFTEEGTFAAAMHQLKELAEIGITIIELMPLNDFPGHFGWGYDGVNLFAPTRLYGKPEDVKTFINYAHELGLGVILDVVYNHLGPAGNDLYKFSKSYCSKEKTTEWGEAINYDRHEVREYFLINAKYWIEEFHFDGVRVDATPWFYSSTPKHILEDITQTVKEAGKKRKTICIGENEEQNTRLLENYKDGGYGFDALWNDDFHHSAHVRLTGKREAYYTDYLGSPQEFIAAVKYGFLYQGQYYTWQKKNRGTFFLRTKPTAFINFLENHDQIANSGRGERLQLRSHPGVYRALTAFMLLSPNVPMLFQGQEFGATTPFYYFADHNEDLNKLVYEGRKKFLEQFPRLATSEMQKMVPNPSNPINFTKCKLNFKERESNKDLYKLHKDLIKLRRDDPVFANVHLGDCDGAILGADSFLLRFFGPNEEAGDRLLLVNFGADQLLIPCPEPLLVAGKNKEWVIQWSSEAVEYGGEGTPPLQVPMWKILAYSAVVLKTEKKK